MSLMAAAPKRHLLNVLANKASSLHEPLTPDDWQIWLDLARQHRVAPLLHWRHGQEQETDWPNEIVAQLVQSRRQHALRALNMQRELLDAHHLLQAAGIPHMALKGAFLAWHVYPSPELRPVRDLDILVPAAQALQAYAVLQAGGFEQLQGEHGELGAILEAHKHLPGIHRPGSRIKIELHAHLMHPDEHGGRVHELSMQPGFWERAFRRPLAGHEISYPSPTDQLLHLLIHAITDHKLNNGPLIFSDVAFLLEKHPIDWPLFWQQAETMGEARAVMLGLQLIRYHLGQLDVSWPKKYSCEPQASLLDTLHLFSLRDLEARSDVQLVHRLGAGWQQRLTWLRLQLLPKPAELAVRYPIGKAYWTLPWWYARKWLDGLRRLGGLLRLKHKHTIDEETAVLKQLDAWLTANLPDHHSHSSTQT